MSGSVSGDLRPTASPQRVAADPAVSAWVAASAGTGKTKVLTDRVLNLMLGGAEPHRILCLTFTRAAAAEMNQRIADQLAVWAAHSGSDAINSLTNLLGRPPSEDEIRRASQLFAKVLDTPGGMNIQTIHAFCQSLLSRFPLEAALSPHFSVIDEYENRQIVNSAVHGIVERAGGGDKMLAASLSNVITLIPEGQFSSLVDCILRNSCTIRETIEKYKLINLTIEALFRRLGAPSGISPQDVLAAACTDKAFDNQSLQRALLVLQGGSSGERKRGQTLEGWLKAQSTERPQLFENYAQLFIGEKIAGFPTVKESKYMLTTATALQYPEVERALIKEAERINDMLYTYRAAVIANATASVIRIADALLKTHEQIKLEHAALDFNDLIYKAAALIEGSKNASWVLFKLDGGIDHLLIDEAQDTNAEQWRVVRALTAEFFSGQGRHDNPRTIFAVGDTKQSIFSFQGADPTEFINHQKLFERLTREARKPLATVELTTSFRSTAAILAVVDAIFAGEEASRGVELYGHPITHQVAEDRIDDRGMVELWPEIIGRDEDPPEPWKPPIERIERDVPHARLAKLLAMRISQMLETGELLESKARPIEAGDIMVLVRHRDAFVEEFVRACKERNVPVSGIDRIILVEQIAVMDLLALGHFALLPEDDLTLATVLKSPLVGLNEGLLYEVAHARQGSLWDALSAAAIKSEVFADAQRYLEQVLNAADYIPPFEFFSWILGPLGGRRRLIGRLGHEVEEPIAEFLELALYFHSAHPPTLQGFLHWVEAAEIEVKRDLEQAERNAVRVMTVHGAKGLQAPIVFLPDTMQVPNFAGHGSAPPILWEGDRNDGPRHPFWVPNVASLNPVTATLRNRMAEQQSAEYRRLLYVALTRAEDRLLICGWRRKRKADGCWYDLIRQGLLNARVRIGLCEEMDPFLSAARDRGDFDGKPVVLKVVCPQRKRPHREEVSRSKTVDQPPPWMFQLPAISDFPARRPLVPSHGGREVYRPAPGNLGEGRYRRGRIIHRLLEKLPSIPTEKRGAFARQWLARPSLNLADHEQSQIASEVARIIRNPRFSDIYGPNSLAEVKFSAELAGQLVIGQIDRLVVSADRVSILDYKTDSPAPTDMQQVPQGYLRQMAMYRDAIRASFPNREIECLLLWTAVPHLMPLANHDLDPHMP